MDVVTRLQRRFQELYGTVATIYHAPGRVNLIGEHTDYNDGLVMPAALGLATWVAIAPRPDRRLAIHSEHFGESVEFELDETAPRPRQHWSDYARGVAVMLMRAGHRLRGAEMLIQSDIPLGAGLSSSAAIEVAVGLALLENSGCLIDRVALAQICQRAENEFVGIGCGIMDQFVACCGCAGQALLLDCRSLAYRLLPLPAEARLMICNTMVRHQLASSEYNRRRAECETGVRLLVQAIPEVRALRDVTLAQLREYEHALPAIIYRRCQHVISENARVLAAAAALEQGDLSGFGQLMTESHHSLRDEYEVSCAELDLLVELADRIEGVYGARMTGGGFGGCTINLVKAECAAEFAQKVAEAYASETGVTPEIYSCPIVDRNISSVPVSDQREIAGNRE
jgi:galactokinase